MGDKKTGLDEEEKRYLVKVCRKQGRRLQECGVVCFQDSLKRRGLPEVSPYSEVWPGEPLEQVFHDCWAFTLAFYHWARGKPHIKDPLSYTGQAVENEVSDVIKLHLNTLSACGRFAQKHDPQQDEEHQDNREAREKINEAIKSGLTVHDPPELEEKGLDKRFWNNEIQYWSIVADYKSGLTQEQLASKYCVSPRTMGKYLAKNFITKGKLTPREYLERYLSLHEGTEHYDIALQFYNDAMENLEDFLKYYKKNR